MKVLRIKSPLLREVIAECLGTFVLVCFGDGAGAQSTLTNGEKGDFFSSSWASGIGVMVGLTISIGVSGGHLNPAVSLAMAIAGKFPFKKVLFYWLAQYLGAFLAAATIYGVYDDAILTYAKIHSNGSFAMDDTMDNPGLAGIFSTYPASWMSIQGGIVDQIFGTFLLLLAICAIIDKKNNKIPDGLIPMYIGFVIVGIGSSFGANTGYALNPARDLGPRLLSLIAGWDEVFSYKDYTWFWIPIVGPHVGAILGVIVYIVLVGAHWQKDEEIPIKEEAPYYGA